MTVHPVVLAAGRGTRMKSDRAKVLHDLGGRPLILWVLDAVGDVGSPTVVVGHQAEAVARVLPPGTRAVIQEPQRGTGDAVEVALEALQVAAGDVVLVVPGDMPLLRRRTIAAVLASHASSGAAATVLTATVADPSGYGRVVRGPEGVREIVEDRDASPTQRGIREINTSVYAFDGETLAEVLPRLGSNNSQDERYLTDTIGIIVGNGATVGAVAAPPDEAEGVNSRSELALAARSMERRGLLAEGDEGSPPRRVPGYAARRQKRANREPS